jgi:DNA invertase Pin-like site-specific DNA recombinase
MADARKTPRPFDMVVVNEGRGIGRTGRAFWKWVWELEDLGVWVAVVKKDYDNSTSTGRSQMRKDADYAEEERELIRERTQGGIQEKAEEGGWPGGRTPYGWMIENKGQKGLSRPVRDPEEHAVLQRAWELIVLKGKNAEEAALTLNAEGRLTREGKPWSNKNLLNKLKSEAVQEGRVTFRKEGRAQFDQNGEPVWGASVAIELEPAFTKGEVDQLKVALARGSTARNSDGAPAYPLTKRITGLCGRHYSGFHRPGVRGYRCSGKQPAFAGAERCSCSQVSADLIEQAVWARVCALLGDAEQLRRLSREWTDLAQAGKVDYAQRIKELDGQIEELTEAIDAAAAVAARRAAKQGKRGKEAEEAVERAVRPLEDELSEAQRLRSEAASWERETREVQQRARDLTELARAASHRLETLPPEQRARLIELLDIRVQLTSSAPRACRGRKASLPEYEVVGSIEPRLLLEHMKTRFRAESCPEVSSAAIRFRLRVAASLTAAHVRSPADHRAA